MTLDMAASERLQRQLVFRSVHHAPLALTGANTDAGHAGHRAVTSAAAEVEPRHPGGALPADLLAMLCWDWSLLQARLHGWQGSVRLRGKAGRRGEDAQFTRRGAAYLAHTLAEPPLRFDEKLRPARLGVLLRHAIPVVAYALLAMMALSPDTLRAARESPLTLGLLFAPPALLLLYLLRGEQPSLAWPTWPRPLSGHVWWGAR